MLNLKISLFSDVIVRRSKGKLWLTNRRDTWLDPSAIPIANLERILEIFNVKLGEWTQDEYSEYCPVIRLKTNDPSLPSSNSLISGDIK
jgi:hypothetical protein